MNPTRAETALLLVTIYALGLFSGIALTAFVYWASTKP
jgi:hypothetical protein